MLLEEFVNWIKENLQPTFGELAFENTTKEMPPDQVTFVDFLEEYYLEGSSDGILEVEDNEDILINRYNSDRSTYKAVFNGPLRRDENTIRLIVNNATKDVEEIQLFSTFYYGYSAIIHDGERVTISDQMISDMGFEDHLVLLEDSINNINLSLLKCRLMNPLRFISFVHKNYSILLSYLERVLSESIGRVYVEEEESRLNYVYPRVTILTDNEEDVNSVVLELDNLRKTIRVKEIGLKDPVFGYTRFSQNRNAAEFIKYLTNLLEKEDISSLDYTNFGLLDYL